MNNQIAKMPVIAELVESIPLEKTKAELILSEFSTFFEQASEWERKANSIQIKDVDDKENMTLARQARLQLKEIRVNAEHQKKKRKENILLEGRFIDGLFSAVVMATKPLEDELLEKEQYVQRVEEERRARLQSERTVLLQPYGVNGAEYNLATMSEETFSELLEGSKLRHEHNLELIRKEEEARLAKQKAEQEAAAAKAKAEREERERIQAENQRLRQEQEEQRKAQAKAEAERKRVEREAAEKEAAAKKALEDARRAAEEQQRAADKALEDARIKAEEEQRKAKAEADAKIAAQNAAHEAELARIEAEKQAKVEAEESKARRLSEALDENLVIDFSAFISQKQEEGFSLLDIAAAFNHAHKQAVEKTVKGNS